jgi:hypothetical protein
MKIPRGSKLYPATTHSELAAIFDEIDRSSVKGKRDYAIILLGAILGVRAIDIIRLRLTDINWQRGDITIIQSKTDMAFILPLTEDIGQALRDYIFHSRRPTGSDIVFQRIYVPFTPITDAISIGNMFDEYRKKAGLPRNAFDGKSFHSLRRALGTNTSHDMDDLEEMARRILMISGGKIAYDGDFDGLRGITGNLTRFIVTMDENSSLFLNGSKLISAANGVYEFEVDVTKTPIKQLLKQLSDADGIKDVEINKAPIEQVIAGLYTAWNEK